MILRSVGIAGAIVVGLAVASALTLLPAVLTILGPRIDRLAIRRVSPRPGSDGPWARLARRVMRHPVAVLVPTLAFILLLGSPFLHVRFNAPDSSILPASVPSRRLRSPPKRIRRGRVRADRPGDPDAGQRRRAGQPGRAVRLLATAGGGSPGDEGRGPRRRRPEADPRSVHAPVRRPERPARSLHPDGAGRHDQRAI